MENSLDTLPTELFVDGILGCLGNGALLRLAQTNYALAEKIDAELILRVCKALKAVYPDAPSLAFLFEQMVITLAENNAGAKLLQDFISSLVTEPSDLFAACHAALTQFMSGDRITRRKHRTVLFNYLYYSSQERKAFLNIMREWTAMQTVDPQQKALLQAAFDKEYRREPEPSLRAVFRSLLPTIKNDPVTYESLFNLCCLFAAPYETAEVLGTHYTLRLSPQDDTLFTGLNVLNLELTGFISTADVAHPNDPKSLFIRLFLRNSSFEHCTSTLTVFFDQAPLHLRPTFWDLLFRLAIANQGQEKDANQKYTFFLDKIVTDEPLSFLRPAFIAAYNALNVTAMACILNYVTENAAQIADLSDDIFADLFPNDRIAPTELRQQLRVYAQAPQPADFRKTVRPFMEYISTQLQSTNDPLSRAWQIGLHIDHMFSTACAAGYYELVTYLLSQCKLFGVTEDVIKDCLTQDGAVPFSYLFELSSNALPHNSQNPHHQKYRPDFALIDFLFENFTPENRSLALAALMEGLKSKPKTQENTRAHIDACKSSMQDEALEAVLRPHPRLSLTGTQEATANDEPETPSPRTPGTKRSYSR